MASQGVQPRAFTSRYDRLSNVLANQVGVTATFDATDDSQIEPAVRSARPFTAVWDTGATNSVITQKVIDDCGLKPTGIVQVNTAQGSYRTETFLAAILLPNRVSFPEVKVSKGILTGFTDVLIGMDIIGAGDFAVTNVDGETVFSFRLPSVECIDFVKIINAQSGQPKTGRNEPCPCGSGKKYKRCHG